MKKIIVIGCPGSGKSRFSIALHEITNIPLFHLDMMYWNPDKTTVEKNVFLDRLAHVLDKESWIIDGNYASSLEMRMEACDTVVFLDYPVDVCLGGIKERMGKKRPDMPWVETEEDEEFIEFVKTYGKKNRPAVIELLEKYKNKNVLVFESRNEADDFLSCLRRKTQEAL